MCDFLTFVWFSLTFDKKSKNLYAVFYQRSTSFMLEEMVFNRLKNAERQAVADHVAAVKTIPPRMKLPMYYVST